MRSARLWFNLVLMGFWLGASLVAPEAEASEKKKDKPKAIERIRVHVESRRDLKERTLPAVVGRSNPSEYWIEKLPILNEIHLDRAVFHEELGGFAVELQFDSMGTKLLESHSSAAAGRHLVVATEIDGETRWLAAPLMRKRLGDGRLVFSPDASREETERMVKDLNAAVKKRKSQWLK
jgi:hypothetical protein